MKKKLAVLVLCCLIVGLLSTTASAANAANSVSSYITVNADGDCQVTMTVTLQLDAPNPDLTFPLPRNARNITLNGSSVSTTKTSSAIEVAISKVTGGLSGQFSLRFDYTIPNAVAVTEDGTLQLTLPLLSGFSYPVLSMDFVITLPGDITGTPDFTSIYQQLGIESNLHHTIQGNIISGSTIGNLNDHEAVTMTLAVEESMFPTVSTYRRTGNPEIIPMLIISGLAVMYWLIFLPTAPLLRSRSVTPPPGATAGEMASRLTLSGADLTMMVFSWAQLGYLLIQMDGHGRVLLHKRMDMGNERSTFEMRVFQNLFGKRRVVDGTGAPYARLRKSVAGTVPSQRTLCRSARIHRTIFRLMGCIVHIYCGVCVAMNITAIAALQVLLGILLGIFGAASAWKIQAGAFCTHLRSKQDLWISLGCCGAWILLGLLASQVWVPLCSVLGQLLFGFAAAYGGRRTDLGRQNAAQVLGLRSFLKQAPREDLDRMTRQDPEFFFNMMPYALSLGVEQEFARAFGRSKLDQCPYLISRVHGRRSPEDWAALMAEASRILDDRYRRMELEKWTSIRFR